MYLQPRLFACADTFLTTDVSTIPWYLLLQMLFWGPTYLQLAFLWTCRCFSACLTCIIASASYFFWDLKILPSQILHLHHTFSITWGCSSLKLCIFNLLFLCFADTSHPNFASSIPPNPLSQIPSSNILRVLFTSWTEPIHYFQKIDIRNSREYEMGAGDT